MFFKKKSVEAKIEVKAEVNFEVVTAEEKFPVKSALVTLYTESGDISYHVKTSPYLGEFALFDLATGFSRSYPSTLPYANSSDPAYSGKYFQPFQEAQVGLGGSNFFTFRDDHGNTRTIKMEDIRELCISPYSDKGEFVTLTIPRLKRIEK